MRTGTRYVPRIWSQPRKHLTAAGRRALLAKRDAWLRQIHPAYLFFPLLDLLPGIYFFAKNRRGQLMFLSGHSLKMYHVPDETSLIGLTDFDLNPPGMARAYVQDDKRIYATGEPLLHKVELWFDEFGIPEWFLVNKLPIRSRRGAIVGIMGFSQSLKARGESLPTARGIARAVDFIRQNYSERVTLAQLVREASLSGRQLQRQFKSYFGLSPHEFLIKTRVLAACHMLRETGDCLADVALACGFCDQSAFAQHFHKHVGETPARFRRDQTAE